MRWKWTSGVFWNVKQPFWWLPASYFWVTGSRKAFRALKEPKFTQCSYVHKFIHPVPADEKPSVCIKWIWLSLKKQTVCVYTLKYTCKGLKQAWLLHRFLVPREYTIRCECTSNIKCCFKHINPRFTYSGLIFQIYLVWFKDFKVSIFQFD